MGSKVSWTEAQARELAENFGLRVTTTGKTGTLKQLMVGKLLVQHNSHTSGAAGWMVGDVRVGYKGEAMAVAAYAQSFVTYPPFDPRDSMGRAFNKIRAAQPELRAAA